MPKTLSVKDIRGHLSEAIRDAEAGDTTVITRYGKPVAMLSPVDCARPAFPDMAEFRKSIKVRGKALSDIVRRMRDEERY